VDQQLRQAIADRRLIAFRYDGCDRVGEPHDYGIANGEQRLFYFQVGGSSKSGGRLPDWRWAVVSKIEELRLLDERFAGARPAPSGRHQKWERLIASVSREVG
jgi:hypothetical protein